MRGYMGKCFWMVWSALLYRLCVFIIVEWACNAREAINPLKSTAVPRISHYIWLLSSLFFSFSSFLLDQINFWQMFGKSSYPVIHIYKSWCCSVVPILPLHWSQKIIWENATFPVTNLEDLVSLAQFWVFQNFNTGKFKARRGSLYRCFRFLKSKQKQSSRLILTRGFRV